MSFMLYVTRANPEAVLPRRGSAEAAGYDLAAYCPDGPLQVNARDRLLIPTGIKMEIGLGYYGRIAPRSGLALKHGIDVLAGVIDSDYRGEIGVILMNLSDRHFHVFHGDRIAQIIITPHAAPGVIEVRHDDFIERATARGAGGYGSTGV